MVLANGKTLSLVSVTKDCYHTALLFKQSELPFLVATKALPCPGLLPLCSSPDPGVRRTCIKASCSLSLSSGTFPGLYLLCKGNRDGKREEMCCNVAPVSTIEEQEKRYTSSHE